MRTQFRRRLNATVTTLLLALMGIAHNVHGQTCVAPPSGLVSWWPGEANATDIAGTNNGILQGGLTFASGEVGQAFSFNGTDADVRIPASASLDVGAGNGFSIEAWVNPSDLLERPIAEWNSGSYETHFWISTPVSSGGGGTGCIYANLRDINGIVHLIASPAGIITANSFQHIALTYDKTSGNAALYLNGAAVAQKNLGIFTPNTTTDLYLGLRPFDAGAGIRFSGLIDEVSLYNRVLSLSEIQAIYNAVSAGKCQTPSPPSILTQPQSQTVNAGANVTFSAVASGSSPLYYQWQLDGTSLLDATNSSLTLTNVQPADACTYTLIVVNSYDSVTSSNATLTVNTFPASIVTQPHNQTVNAGTSASFSVVASGTAPLTYQWQFNGTNLTGANASV